ENESSTLAEYNFQMEEMLMKAESNAEQLIQQSKLQAQAVKDQITLEKEAWEQEKKKISEMARQEGFSQGFNEGKIEGYNEYLEALSFAKEIVQRSKIDYEQHVESAEKTILSLGIKVAEKIIGLKLEENESFFLSIVRRALKEAREYTEIQLHVNPVHYGYILSQKEDLLAVFSKEVDIYIYPDEDLSKESCIIESANGRIEASIDKQLEEIKRRLMELLESEDE
ncbi:MAG TPA: flagellar assembly protein FliH, partial [Bacillales bacterium]|nr:flagellar assembly protein FliH [Bacillales bacterium]